MSKQINPNDLNNISYSTEQNIDENSKKYLSMSSVNKLVRNVIILKNKFNQDQNITFKLIVNFVLNYYLKKN